MLLTDIVNILACDYRTVSIMLLVIQKYKLQIFIFQTFNVTLIINVRGIPLAGIFFIDDASKVVQYVWLYESFKHKECYYSDELGTGLVNTSVNIYM